MAPSTRPARSSSPLSAPNSKSRIAIHSRPTKSQASARSDRFTRRLRQRLLQRRQLLESLRHRGGAADDVVHDGDGLAVVLAEPRLLERVDRAALLVLLA